MYYRSNNSTKNLIGIKTTASMLEHVDDNNKPYYYINMLLRNGAEIQWRYYSEEMRDKEISEIRKLIDKINK